MTKKILALIMSVILCATFMVPAVALDLGGLLGGASGDSSEAEGEASGGFDINSILSSDIFQQIMANEEVIDLTSIVMELVVKFGDTESLKAMGQEKAMATIQSMVDTLAGAINQLYGNKDLIITYDPLEVMGNLFDLDTESLTTKNPEDETTHPDELEINMGDVDMDGKLTAADARLVLRRAARIITFTMEQEALADVDDDGKITANDARLLLRVTSGLETLDEEE